MKQIYLISFLLLSSLIPTIISSSTIISSLSFIFLISFFRIIMISLLIFFGMMKEREKKKFWIDFLIWSHFSTLICLNNLPSHHLPSYHLSHNLPSHLPSHLNRLSPSLLIQPQEQNHFSGNEMVDKEMTW